MECPNCGHQVRGRFCGNCGTQVQPARSTPSGPAVDATSVLRLGVEATSVLRPIDLPDSAAQPRQSAPEADPYATARFPASGPGAADDAGSPSPGDAPLPGEPPPTSGWQTFSSDFSGGAGASRGAPTVTMRTMTLGDVVSDTFTILRARLRSFLQIGAAYTAAMFVAWSIFGLATGGGFLAGGLTGGLGSSLLGLILGALVLIALAIVAGAVAAVAYINIARGAETVEGDDVVSATLAALQRAWQSAPGLLLALLVLAGVWIGFSIVLGVVSAVFAQISGALSFLVSLIGLVGGIWLGVSFAFVPQTSVIDQSSPTGALSESMQLVSGYWWRTLGFLLVAWLIGVGMSIAGFIVIAILGIIVSHIPILGAVILALLYAALLAIFYAFYITYGTLMFFDLKARRSGMAQEVALIRW